MTSSTNETRTYDFKDIESKWLPVWDELEVFKPADDGTCTRGGFGRDGFPGGGMPGGGTGMPSDMPTDMPSGMPTDRPSGMPEGMPTDMPSGRPSGMPSGRAGGGFGGIDMSDTKVQAALKACGIELPSGMPSAPPSN